MADNEALNGAVSDILVALAALKGSRPYVDPAGRGQTDYRITKESYEALEAAILAVRELLPKESTWSGTGAPSSPTRPTVGRCGSTG